jgi:uncharacterized membrane protein YeaQ/YmgE (transglycosylase-associated protein family)
VDLLELLMLLVIVGICGAIAQWIVAVPVTLPVTIIVGVVGAYLGTLIASLLRIPKLLPIGIDTVDIDLVWAIVGSILLLLLLKAIYTSGPRLVRRRP